MFFRQTLHWFAWRGSLSCKRARVQGSLSSCSSGVLSEGAPKVQSPAKDSHWPSKARFAIIRHFHSKPTRVAIRMAFVYLASVLVPDSCPQVWRPNPTLFFHQLISLSNTWTIFLNFKDCQAFQELTPKVSFKDLEILKPSLSQNPFLVIRCIMANTESRWRKSGGDLIIVVRFLKQIHLHKFADSITWW